MHRFTALLVSGCLVACQATPLTPKLAPPALSGHVDWRKPSLRIALSVSDVQAGATVTLIDPATKATRIATISSPTDGTFTFPFTTNGTQLAPGYYWLEAARFIRGESRAGVTLRTIVQMSPTGWRSISGANEGDPIEISPLTTAVARVRALDATVTDAATMGIVTPGATLPAALGSYTPALLRQLAEEVDATVNAGGDGAGDLPLPVTVSPAVGTPGITALTWSGLPSIGAIEQIRQTASGSDIYGSAVTTDGVTLPIGPGTYFGQAPTGVVGPVQLRLQIGSSRTLPVPWTAVGASTLQADAASFAFGVGPAGAHAAWLDSAGNLNVADMADLAMGTTNTVATGIAATDVSVGSTDASTLHVVASVGGDIHHWFGAGASWTDNGTIVTGTNAGNAQIDDDGAGTLWCAYLDDSASPRAIRVRSFSVGVWSAPETIGSAAIESFRLVSGAEPNLVWSEDDGAGKHVIKHSRRTAGAWTTPVTLSTPGQDATSVSLALNTTGDPHVAWAGETFLGVSHPSRQLLFRAYASDAWLSPEVVRTGVTPYVRSPNVVLSPSGHPVMTWIQGDNRPAVQMAHRDRLPSDPGVWASPSTLEVTPATTLRGAPATGRYWLAWRSSTGTALRGIPLIW